MRVKLKGSGWKIMPKYLSGYSRNLPTFAKAILKVSGETYMKDVHKRIESQPSDVPALAPYTKEKKAREGKDPRIWIETGFWKKNLGIKQVKKGVIFAGASDKKIHQPSGKKMSEIAKIFEYGSKADRIPARPIFRVVAKKFGKKFAKVMGVHGMEFFSSAGEAKGAKVK